jgi:hypothetical protein
MRWYWSRNGETTGPIEEAEIVQQVKGGTVDGQVMPEAGGQWAPITNSPFAQFAPKPKPKSVTWWQVLLVLAAGVLFVWYQTSRPTSSSSSNAAPAEPEKPAAEHDKIAAWTMAQMFVKDHLKSPGSADFGSLLKEYQSPNERVEDLGDGKYRVTGWVDAQNAFGAKIRNRFGVTVQYTGDSKWVAVEGPVLSEW